MTTTYPEDRDVKAEVSVETILADIKAVEQDLLQIYHENYLESEVETSEPKPQAREHQHLSLLF